MRTELKAKAYVGIIIGIIVQLAGNMIAQTSEGGAVIGLVIFLAGLLFFVWGCSNFAEAKGHSKWLGLLGVMTCIGLLILFFIPEKRRSGF